MTDKPSPWEMVLMLFLVAPFVIMQFADFSNTDISIPALITAILAFLATLAGRHHISR